MAKTAFAVRDVVVDVMKVGNGKVLIITKLTSYGIMLLKKVIQDKIQMDVGGQRVILQVKM